MHCAGSQLCRTSSKQARALAPLGILKSQYVVVPIGVGTLRHLTLARALGANLKRIRRRSWRQIGSRQTRPESGRSLCCRYSPTSTGSGCARLCRMRRSVPGRCFTVGCRRGTVKLLEKDVLIPAPGLDHAAVAVPVTSAQTRKARARARR
jgi:hypothetical protein